MRKSRRSSWRTVLWSGKLLVLLFLIGCSRAVQTSAYHPRLPILHANPYYFDCFGVEKGCVALLTIDWEAYKAEIVTACIAAGETEEVCLK